MYFISCVYRTPGSCIDEFNTKISDLHSKDSGQGIIICGDFNIDLLKFQVHTKTTDFVNNMFSLGLYPLILKPSRITKDSATLIDNIFVNLTETHVKSGLLLAGISDHLPVFGIFHSKIKINKVDEYRLVRWRIPEAVENFKHALGKHDWREVHVEDINDSYNAFLNTFTLFYDYHCPVRQIKVKHNTKQTPWLTKGLEKACKKKRTL